MKNKNIKLESDAFDSQIKLRVKNKHLPDIRNTKRNEYFYNNVWRDPYLVSRTFGETVKIFKRHIPKKSKIIEIGCGPGHIALELARAGHRVHGIDLSQACIDVALGTAMKKDKQLIIKKKLTYECTDFTKLINQKNKYNIVIFCGSLSHFTNLKKISEMLKKITYAKSKIMIWDTCIEQYKQSDAIILGMIRILLSQNHNYFQKIKIPKNLNEFKKYSKNIFKELSYVDEGGKNIQSPNDNSQNLKSMLSFLNSNYNEIEFIWESSFSRMLVGGIRGQNIIEEKKLVDFLWNIETLLINEGVLSPAFFHWIGRRKN